VGSRAGRGPALADAGAGAQGAPLGLCVSAAKIGPEAGSRVTRTCWRFYGRRCRGLSSEGTGHVRVTTAFNKMLDLPGASVAMVTFSAEGLVLGLRRRTARPVCPCGKRGSGVYDRSVRRWRHLDWGTSKV